MSLSVPPSPALSSGPASSSAVTLPTPGKSILKKPPPPPPPLFSLSRLSKLLPAAPAAPPPRGAQGGAGAGAGDGARVLKRAHFILPQLATVYPISTANPPSMPGTADDKREAEQREHERRRRVVRGSSVSSLTAPVLDGGAPPAPDYWGPDKVESFYQECCEGRDEFPHPRISAALRVRRPLLYLKVLR
jgi:protein phosphatase 1 regulatory subunit 37